MASATVTNTFVAGTTINPSAVNQNFTDLLTFLNNSVVHVDGSKAFTGVPTGPATDPSSVNHLTRKAYVDGLTLLRSKGNFAATLSPIYGGTFTTASNQLLITGETYEVTSNGGSTYTRNLPNGGFPNGLIAIIPSIASVDGAGASPTIIATTSTTKTTAQWRVVEEDNTAFANGALFRVAYIALGW